MAEPPPGANHREAPDLDAWDPWTPSEAAARLAGIDVPWCVVGGWSIDLFLGEQTRRHEDLEIAAPRAHFGPLRRALDDLDLFLAGNGEVRALGRDEDPPADLHQHWVLDGDARAWRMDVMLEPGDADTWVFRRDPAIRAPRTSMVDRTGDGIPYLLPHGTLLYKAKAAREKDEADLAACLPRLRADVRAWLADALERAHPDHPWTTRVRDWTRS